MQTAGALLTSDQVHVDQVGFDVSRFLRLVPQALRGGGGEGAGTQRQWAESGEDFGDVRTRVGLV